MNFIWIAWAIILPISGGIYGLPQALRSYKQKDSHGISRGTIILWFLNELMSLVWVWHIADLSLFIKYAVSLVFVGTIAYFKFCNKEVETKPES